MDKSQLKTGMILEFFKKPNEYGMVLLGTKNGDIVSGDAWFQLDEVEDESLFYSDKTPYSVRRIFQPQSNMSFLNAGFGNKLNMKDMELIWEQSSKVKEQLKLEIVELREEQLKILDRINEIENQIKYH